MSTVMKISPQRQVRIPKKVLDALKLTPDDYVEIDIEMNHAVLKPRKLIDPTQEWYWTKEWQKSEKEVDKEIEKEECSPLFQTAEEALKWLDK